MLLRKLSFLDSRARGSPLATWHLGRMCTLEEVAVGQGITRERVRQLESRALRELRTTAPDLELYLRAE